MCSKVSKSTNQLYSPIGIMSETTPELKIIVKIFSNLPLDCR